MDPALLGAGLAALPTVAALAMVAGIRRGAKRRRIREALQALDVPGTRRDLAVIIAMGGDPLKHRLEPVNTQTRRGMRLVDAEGNPVRFMTEKQMRSPAMRSRFLQAARSTQLTVEAP